MAKTQRLKAASNRSKFLPVLLAAVGIAFAPATALLALALLLPTAMAWIADASPGRPSVRAVLLFGLAASCGPFDLLWRSGNRLDTSFTLAADLNVLALAWSAQAGGWLLTQLLPLAIGAWFEAETRIGTAKLATRKRQLAEEWQQGSKDLNVDFSTVTQGRE